MNFDKIFSTGKNGHAHLQTLHTVFKRLDDCNLNKNVNKLNFFKECLDILGFDIYKSGLHKSLTEARAIADAPKPTDSKKLQTFIGLIKFYARFLPGRAENLKHLMNAQNGMILIGQTNAMLHSIE